MKLKMSDDAPRGATQSGRRYRNARGDPTKVSIGSKGSWLTWQKCGLDSTSLKVSEKSTHRLAKRYRKLSAMDPREAAHMYVPIPASHSIRKISRFRSLRGILCCRIWSSFVKFSPSAFKHEATRTINRPSIVFCHEPRMKCMTSLVISCKHARGRSSPRPVRPHRPHQSAK